MAIKTNIINLGKWYIEYILDGHWLRNNTLPLRRWVSRFSAAFHPEDWPQITCCAIRYQNFKGSSRALAEHRDDRRRCSTDSSYDRSKGAYLFREKNYRPGVYNRPPRGNTHDYFDSFDHDHYESSKDNSRWGNNHLPKSHKPWWAPKSEVTVVERPVLISLEEMFTGVTKKKETKRELYDFVTGAPCREKRFLDLPIKKGLKAGSKIKIPFVHDQVELHFIVQEVSAV